MTPADLRAWRERHGLTQVELAQRLDVDPSAVSRWERGIHALPGSVPLALKGLEAEKAVPA